jgi:hypothetical protein
VPLTPSAAKTLEIKLIDDDIAKSVEGAKVADFKK